MSQQDAILTVCHRMPFWKVEAFVKSLRQTGYSGRTVFFGSFLNRETEKALEASGVEIEKFWFFGRHVRQCLSQPWKFWRIYFAISQPIWLRDMVARRVLHLFYLRHLLYLRFLERNKEIERVLMCDCRDVFFQRNPFSDWIGNGLQAYAEDESILIGDCKHHRRWIKSLADEETLLKLNSFPRLCAGTIMADRNTAITMLKTLVKMTLDCSSLEAFDGDQGLYNILVHEKKIPGIRVFPNGVSSVFTASGNLEKFCINREGWLSRNDGNAFPIIHQYDRSPLLTSLLLSKICLHT